MDRDGRAGECTPGAAALDGIRILECGQDIAAPYAAMLLAEQGAEVVKIEPPGGDRARALPGFHVWNRSKRSIVLDVHTSEGLRALRAACAEADVLISDWAPARLPITEPIRRAINPALIHCWMPPYGSRGPFVNAAATDDLVAARSTLLANQWAHRDGPVFLTIPIASYGTAMLAAGAVCAALKARRRSGRGQVVEVSWLAGALAMQTGTLIDHPALQRVMTLVRDPLGPIPVYRLFKASDGWLFLACGNPVFWNKLCLVFERPELVSDPRFEGAPWAVTPAHWEELKALVQSIIETRPRDEWLRRLGEADIPCAPVLTRHDFLGDPQLRELEMMREVIDPEFGHTWQMGVPVYLRGTPGQMRGPAPAREQPAAMGNRIVHLWSGERSVTRAAGDASPAATHTVSGPLSGVLVLDFTSYIAGPSATTALALAGADVIKVETSHGDPFRVFGFGFYGWNQGKRGLSLDFAKPTARELIHDLVRRADVLVENLRPGATRRLGIDYDTVRVLNPRLVYGSLTAFGSRGPRGHEAGFDPLLQARSGLMAAQGGHGHDPVFFACAVSDYASGLLCAFGVMAALWARERTGRGQLVETSLAQAALAVQAGEFIFYAGRPDLEDGGPDLIGRHPLRRAYRCRDGWIFVSADTEHRYSINDPRHHANWSSPLKTGDQEGCSGRLRQLLEATRSRADVATEPAEGACAERLAALLADCSRAEALAEFAGAGIAADPALTLGEVFSDVQITANDLTYTGTAPKWGAFQQTGVLVKYTATPAMIQRSAPQLGEHSEDVLSHVLGYTSERIQRLKADGVVITVS